MWVGLPEMWNENIQNTRRKKEKGKRKNQTSTGCPPSQKSMVCIEGLIFICSREELHELTNNFMDSSERSGLITYFFFLCCEKKFKQRIWIQSACNQGWPQ